jgi:SAM-dependent methyltransferase
MTYNSEGVRAYFDSFAEREWQRLEADVQGRSSYAVHKRLLERYVRPGMRVLDIGSGPGRFAIDIASLGAHVVVGDISQVQVDLARKNLGQRGLLDRVEGFHRLDVLDLGSMGHGRFDLVVAYGGVVSYTRERYADAMREFVRVLRPGGALLLSVMSLHGVLRLIGPLDAAAVTESLEQHLDWEAILAGADIVLTTPGSPEFHQPMALFTSAGLSRAIADAGLALETMASANALLPAFTKVPNIEASEVASQRLIEVELAVAWLPGLLDAGGHLIAAASKPN